MNDQPTSPAPTGPAPLSLLNIDSGALLEVFNHSLAKIVRNIADPNTEPEATRGITLKLKIKPTPDRSGAVVSYTCETSEAGVPARKSSIFISRQGGQLNAYPRDIRQQVLALAPEQPNNVKEMPTGTTQLQQ